MKINFSLGSIFEYHCTTESVLISCKKNSTLFRWSRPSDRSKSWKVSCWTGGRTRCSSFSRKMSSGRLLILLSSKKEIWTSLIWLSINNAIVSAHYTEKINNAIDEYKTKDFKAIDKKILKGIVQENRFDNDSYSSDDSWNPEEISSNSQISKNLILQNIRK